MSQAKTVNPFRYFTPEQRGELQAGLEFVADSLKRSNAYSGPRVTIERMATLQLMMDWLEELK